MFEKLRIRNRIKVQRASDIEGFASSLPVKASDEDLIPSENAALEHAVDHVLWYLYNDTANCHYCGSQVRYWTQNPRILLTIRNVRVFKDVPKGAKDLRIVLRQGCLADLKHSGFQTSCPKCSLELTYREGEWGLSHPRYGSSTREYVFETGGEYKTGGRSKRPRAPSCFSSNMLILSRRGEEETFKPISQMRVGDTVISYSLVNGRPEEDLVIDCHASPENLFYRINRELEVTGSHPFLTMGGVWKKASSLEHGDLIRGYTRPVTIRTVEIREEYRRFFNFHVSRSHSYYVSPDGCETYAVHNGK